jgi:hypothetical protein
LLKFSVKKNRSFRDFFFATEGTLIRASEHELQATNDRDSKKSAPRIRRHAIYITENVYSGVEGGRYAN